MKVKVKFALVFLLIFIATATMVSSASATELIFQNMFDNSINMAVVYYDKASGLWTTRGWWSVEGNKSRTVNINNIDSSKDVYYAGVNGNALYYDKSTLNSDSTNRWVSDDSFRFDSAITDKPAGKNVRTVRFYKCRYSKGAAAYVVRIDTKPAG